MPLHPFETNPALIVGRRLQCLRFRFFGEVKLHYILHEIYTQRYSINLNYLHN